VPTPFYHLQVAEDLLRHPALADHIRQILTSQRCIFLFGNTAPDVQVVSHQSREDTHFFSLPFVQDALPAWEVFLISYPSLSNPRQLPPKQAAFLSGYLCHLQADWLWVKDIFDPIFGPSSNWNTFWHRLYIHNVLRTYLDFPVFKGLTKSAGFCLEAVLPERWLPFVEDRYLIEWRNEVFEQLLPGAAAHTVEVFAERQGIPPKEYYRLLNNEGAMEAEVFSHISRQVLDDYRKNLLAENLHLLEMYYNGLQVGYTALRT
jgi:hypothetical protein